MEQGAILIFLAFPVGSEIGIDLHSWNTGDQFRGVKMIPPGMHYIYYSALNKEKERAPRTGFFHMFHNKDIVVRKWDPVDEELVIVQNEDHLDLDLERLDAFLGPYPYDNWKKWVALSSRLTVDVVTKIEPRQKQMSSAANLIASQVQPPSSVGVKKRRLRAERENSLLPLLKGRPGTGLNLTPIPDSPFPSLDTSYILEQLLSCCKTSDQLLGELQMAFLCFLVGEVYSAFEYWKKLVNVICSADRYLVRDSEFILDFIEDLYFQMREVPADCFADIVSQNSFLTQLNSAQYFDNVSSCDKTDVKLKKKNVTEKFSSLSYALL